MGTPSCATLEAWSGTPSWVLLGWITIAQIVLWIVVSIGWLLSSGGYWLIRAKCLWCLVAKRNDSLIMGGPI